MKIPPIILLLLLSGGLLWAQQKVTLDLVQQPASEIFSSIVRQSGFAVYYNPSETDSLLLTVQCKDCTPETALLQALEGTSLHVSVFEDKYIFILKDKQLTTQLPEDYFAIRTRRMETMA